MKVEKNLPKDVSYRHDFVNKRLKQLWENDEVFKSYFQRLFDYYYSKLSKVSQRLNQEEFFNRFFNYVTDLFYQGYYLGRELLEHEEVMIGDSFFEQPNGIIKEQTYDILNGAAGDLVQILSHEESGDFESWVLEEDDSYKMNLMQIKIDIACLGAYQAFLDERNSRKIFIKPEPENELKGKLHRSDDLFFVDPQKFLICLFVNSHTEIWDLMLWSTIESRERKIGEIHINLFNVGNMKKVVDTLPFYQGYEAIQHEKDHVTVSVILTNKINEKEQLPIVAQVVESLKNRLNIESNQIDVTLSITEKIYNYQYSIEEGEST